MIHGKSFLMVCTLFVGVAPGITQAFSPEARGTAMGGTYSAFASGADGLWWNTGALGKPILLSAVLGGGFAGGNNALTLNRIAGIVKNDPTAKAEAVKEIRAAGAWDARIEAGGVGGLTVLGVGVGIFPHVLVSAEDVSPDAAEYALAGGMPLQAGRHYVFKGAYTRAVYTEVAVGYAHSLPTFIPGVSLDAGGTLKYFLGTDYAYTKTVQDFTTGAPTPPVSDSRIVNSTGGKGYGADLGVQASFMGTLKAGIALRNLGSKITWNQAAVQRGYFDPSTLKLVSTTRFEDVALTIPTVVMLGVGGSIPVVGTSVGAQLDINTTDSETSMHFGAEQSIAGILAFRAGYMTSAGPSPAQVTFGLGVGAIIAHLDLGAGFALNGKGGSAAISANVNF